MKHLVFTYGTLMKGQTAHGRFGEMEFFAEGVLRDYGLYEVGTFPAAVPVKGFAVYGELYEVEDETLHQLDRYESEGDLYIRRYLEIEVGPKVFDAWVYEYNGDLTGLELRAPIGKWNLERNPISDYAWYVCYGSNLLGKRFDYYLRDTGSVVYAEKPYMLNGEIYFAKESPSWDRKGVCFLDMNKYDWNSYGWAYLVNKEKIDAISSAEGPLWYPVQGLGKDEYGISAYTVTNAKRLKAVEPGTDYLTIIAAGLLQRFNLSQNEIRRYLNCNERVYISDSMIDEILHTHCE